MILKTAITAIPNIPIDIPVKISFVGTDIYFYRTNNIGTSELVPIEYPSVVQNKAGEESRPKFIALL
ncbi:MAG: hypothetical protein ACTSRG_14075 [Candidatus Helarchaeota archaeon]